MVKSGIIIESNITRHLKFKCALFGIHQMILPTEDKEKERKGKMLVTNVDLKGRRFEYFEQDKAGPWRKESKYVIKIGSMLVRCCYDEIPDGISEACYSGDGYIYKANYAREPMCVLLASGEQEKIAEEDQEGLTTRTGDISFVKGSEFRLFDMAYGPKGGVDAVLLRIEDYMEAIIKVRYVNPEGEVIVSYYIFNGRHVYIANDFEDVPVVAKIAGLKGPVMDTIYSRHCKNIKETDVLDRFTI